MNLNASNPEFSLISRKFVVICESPDSVTLWLVWVLFVSVVILLAMIVFYVIGIPLFLRVLPKNKIFKYFKVCLLLMTKVETYKVCFHSDRLQQRKMIQKTYVNVKSLYKSVSFVLEAFSTLLFKCRYAVHTASIFVLQIGYCMISPDSVE
jgi:hypothetical protein